MLLHGLRQRSARAGLTANTGVITGGDYTDIGSGTTCGPYSMAPCAYHVAPSTVYPACPTSEYSTPFYACSELSYPKAYSEDTQKASASYSLSSVQGIQQNMMQYGAVTGCQSCHSRLVSYRVSTDCGFNLESVCERSHDVAAMSVAALLPATVPDVGGVPDKHQGFLSSQMNMQLDVDVAILLSVENEWTEQTTALESCAVQAVAVDEECSVTLKTPRGLVPLLWMSLRGPVMANVTV